MMYMEYPVLFEKSTDNFSTQGIGVLTDCISVEVTNEFNELPELSLTYLADGDIANELKKGRIIVADAGENYLKQRFRIDNVKKSLDNKIEVAATHLLNDLNYNTLKQNISASAVTPVTAFNLLKNNLEQPESSLVMDSSITTKSDIYWSMNNIDTAMKALGGADGSLLQIYKGEYIFDNETVHYQKTIGEKTGKVIEYGKDLIQINQEENISETYNAVKPYSKVGEGEIQNLLYLPERIIKANSDFEKLRILTKDFSQDKIETIAQMRTRTQQYIRDNKVGVPKVLLEFEMADIKDELGFVDKLDMGDEVTVYFANLEIDTTARVIKTVWDGLLNRYKTVSIGGKKSTTADYQDERYESIDSDINTVHTDVQKIYSGLHDYDEHITDLTTQIDSARDNIFNYINRPGDGIIKFTPSRESPTDMTIESSAGSRFRLNSYGISYDGSGKTAMDSRGYIYADNFIGHSMSSVYMEGGEVHSARITGDSSIDLAGDNGNVVSISGYGLTSPRATIWQLDGVQKMNVVNGGYLMVGGANLWGDGTGRLFVGPTGNVSASLRILNQSDL